MHLKMLESASDLFHYYFNREGCKEGELLEGFKAADVRRTHKQLWIKEDNPRAPYQRGRGKQSVTLCIQKTNICLYMKSRFGAFNQNSSFKNPIIIS